MSTHNSVDRQVAWLARGPAWANAQDRRAIECLRVSAPRQLTRMLGSTALISAGLLLGGTSSALAECTLGGAEIVTLGPLSAGDELVCDDGALDEGVVANAVEEGEAQITITIGDGVLDDGVEHDTTIAAGDASYAISVQNKATVTINRDAVLESQRDGVGLLDEDATITINGGRIVTDDDAVDVDGVDATVTINGGTIDAESVGVDVSGDNAAIRINGGTIYAGENGVTIANADNATITIDGGAIEAQFDGINVSGDDATVTINGGTIDAESVGVDVSGDNAAIRINGGSIYAVENGVTIANADNATITIDGSAIEAQVDGINVSGDNATVTIDGGTIDAQVDGIDVSGDNATVTINGGVVRTASEVGQAVSIFSDTDEQSSLTIGTAATVAGDLLAEGEGDVNLTLNGLEDGAFDHAITGFASLTKTDAGSWALSGTIDDVEEVNIDAGTLFVNGTASNVGLVTIKNGGRLAGTGEVGHTNVEEGGTLAAGNSIGALKVDGNLTFEINSTFEVEVDRLGNSDQVNVSGAANLSGGTVHVTSENGVGGDGSDFELSTAYTILTADERNGEFAAVTDDFAFLDATLSYNDEDVELSLERNRTDFVDVAQTRNQKSVAASINSLQNTADNAVSNSVLRLSQPAAQDAFDQLSGEVHASVGGMLVADSARVRDVVGGRLRGTFDLASFRSGYNFAYHGKVEAPVLGGVVRPMVWGQAYGALTHQKGNGNAVGMTGAAGGMIAGTEMAVPGLTSAGLLAGYGHSAVFVDDRSSDLDTDSFTFGGYGSLATPVVNYSFAGAYTLSKVSSERDVRFGSFHETLSADYHAHTMQAFGRLSPGFDLTTHYLRPFVGLAVIHQMTNGFREKGGVAALSAKSSSHTVGVSEFGVNAVRYVHVPHIGLAKLYGTVAWRHLVGDAAPSQELAFADGDAFQVLGVPLARNTALMETGLELDLGSDLQADLGYQGEFGDDVQAHQFNLRFSKRF